MGRININLGTPPNGNDGDPVRTAFEKVNTMTKELYDKDAALGSSASADITANTNDSTPGRVTKTGDYGIGRPLSGRRVTDRKAVVALATGVSFDYVVAGDRPQGSIDGAMMTLSYNNEFYFQAYFDWRDGSIHSVSKATPTTQETWRKFYNSDNAIGSMASGALIESGSNSNGDYARFASGLQICWRVAISPSLLNASNIGATWVYPMPFVSAPSATANFAAGDVAVSKLFNGPGVVSRTATNCTASMWSNGGFIQSDINGVAFSLMAIGRWK